MRLDKARLRELRRLCTILMETEGNHTLDAPGLGAKVFQSFWTEAGATGVVRLPAAIVTQPFILEATRSWKGHDRIYAVDVEAMLNWLGSVGYLDPDDMAEMLAWLTLEMMGG